MHEENSDLLSINESWLPSSHDWTINIPGHSLFWSDRVKKKGGVCLNVKSDLKSSVKEDLDGECDAQALWVCILKLIIGV